MAPAERIRKRIPCNVSFREAKRSGMVLNLSQSGLFVQTTVSAKCGDDVDLLLNMPHLPEPIPIRAKIVWSRRVDPQFRSVVQGGFGARIEAASEHYFGVLQNIAELREEPSVSRRPERTAVNRESAENRYRVRVKLQGSPRSRFMSVTAGSKKEAEQRALKKAGKGWSLLESPVLEPSATS